MNLRNLVLLVVLAPLTLAAQTAPTPGQRDGGEAKPATQTVAVTGALKDKLELDQTKMQNAQLEATQIQTQAKEAMGQIQANFQEAQKKYAEDLAAARKELKLPESAVLDPKTLSFTVPPVDKKAEVKK